MTGKNILLFFLLLSSCRRLDQTPINTGIVNLVLTSELSTLDPARAYDVISARVLGQAYETLFEYHYLKRPYVLIPLLAKEMPVISNAGKRYTIKIKKGIRYHDNPVFQNKPRFVTAQDFITQLKRIAFTKTTSPGWWLFDDKIKGINEFRKKAGADFNNFKELKISGLTTPDEHTLVIDLIRPYPQMLYALAMTFTSPLPIEAVEKYENSLHKVEVGTGPFYLKKWNKSLSVELDKFEHYRYDTYPSEGDRYANDTGLLKHAGLRIPFVNSIKFHIIKEARTRWLNFRTKKIDLIDIPKDNFTQAITSRGELAESLKKEKIQLQISPALTYWWLSFNMQDPLLGKNRYLRSSIAHAIDVNKYMDIFTNKVAQIANSIYPPGIPGYKPTNHLPYKFDLNLAADHLAKAGYPEGKGLPILTYDVRGNGTTHRQRGEFIRRQLQKIGIKVKVVTNTFPGFLKKAKIGDLQFWQDGWALDYPDAENILQLLYSSNHPPGPNTTHFSDKRFDQLFNELKTLENGARKFKLMAQMEKIVNETLPWSMQYYARDYILLQAHLKNYRHSDLIYNYVKYLKIEPQ